MSQFYFDKSRENDSHALPDAEVFYMSDHDILVNKWKDDDGEYMGHGWYYWACFPGCLPDSDPIGPFESEQAALDDARNY